MSLGFEFRLKELPFWLSLLVFVLFVSEGITWVWRATVAEDFSPYYSQSKTRVPLYVQLGIDFAILIGIILQMLCADRLRDRDFVSLRGHRLSGFLFLGLFIVDIIVAAEVKDNAVLELFLDLFFYGSLQLLSMVKSTNTFRTILVFTSMLFAVIVFSANLTEEVNSKHDTGTYIATALENMLIFECVHLFFDMKTKTPADFAGETDGAGVSGPAAFWTLPPVRYGSEEREAAAHGAAAHGAAAHGAAAHGAAAHDGDDRHLPHFQLSIYDLTQDNALLFAVVCLFYISEIVTIIVRCAISRQSVATLIVQAALNCVCFVVLGYLFFKRSDVSFSLGHHHLFTFFPFVVLLGVDMIVIRSEQGTSYLQLLVDLFGYSVLQLLAGFKVNVTYRSLLIALNFIFVVLIVTVDAVREANGMAGSLFIYEVVEQILVLECLHLALEVQV